MVRIEKEEEGLFQRRQGGVLRERAAGTDGRTDNNRRQKEGGDLRKRVCLCVCVLNNRNDKNIFIILTGLLCANIQSMTDYEVSSSFSPSSSSLCNSNNDKINSIPSACCFPPPV